MTDVQVRRLLIALCNAAGGIRPWANAHGLHPSIVDKFIAGQRGPAPQLLKAMGLAKRIVFVRDK